MKRGKGVPPLSPVPTGEAHKPLETVEPVSAAGLHVCWRRQRDEPSAFRIAAWALLLAGALGGCASPSIPAGSSAPADDVSLACALPTNCIASSGGSAYPPLAYGGPPEQALALLHQALAAFPEAEIIGEDDARLTAIFFASGSGGI